MDSGKTYWFPAKPPGYGWGWGTPQTWQGWVVYCGFFVLLIAGIVVLALWFDGPAKVSGVLAAVGISVWSFFLSAVLIAICFWKGEPPGPFFGRR